jgi:AcrR family transcriptional regulator
MAYKRSEKMAQRKEARRRRLLEAAMALFGRLGYHSATVPMIVREAGSSIGAFYLYFRNKEDIYAVALVEIAGRLSAAIAHAGSSPASATDEMGAAVEGFVRWLARNPAEARLLMEAGTLGGRLAETRRTVVENHIRSVAAALDQAMPGTNPVDRSVLARCWVGAALEAATGWLQAQPSDRPDMARLATLVKSFNLRGAGIAS